MPRQKRADFFEEIERIEQVLKQRGANTTPHGPCGFTGCKPRCIGQSLGFSGPIAAFSGGLDRQIEVEGADAPWSKVWADGLAKLRT